VERIIQRLPVPTKTHYVGKGKLAELLALKENTDYNVVIFDDELSPLQQRNLEQALEIKVIDRAALILDIFARRARTHEGSFRWSWPSTSIFFLVLPDNGAIWKDSVVVSAPGARVKNSSRLTGASSSERYTT